MHSFTDALFTSESLQALGCARGFVFLLQPLDAACASVVLVMLNGYVASAYQSRKERREFLLKFAGNGRLVQLDAQLYGRQGLYAHEGFAMLNEYVAFPAVICVLPALQQCCQCTSASLTALRLKFFACCFVSVLTSLPSLSRGLVLCCAVLVTSPSHRP